jgi:hypothetical protein
VARRGGQTGKEEKVPGVDPSGKALERKNPKRGTPNPADGLVKSRPAVAGRGDRVGNSRHEGERRWNAWDPVPRTPDPVPDGRPILNSGQAGMEAPTRALRTRPTPVTDRVAGEGDFMNGVQGQGSCFEDLDRNDRMAAVPGGEGGVTRPDRGMSRHGWTLKGLNPGSVCSLKRRERARVMDFSRLEGRTARPGRRVGSRDPAERSSRMDGPEDRNDRTGPTPGPEERTARSGRKGRSEGPVVRSGRKDRPEGSARRPGREMTGSPANEEYKAPGGPLPSRNPEGAG